MDTEDRRQNQSMARDRDPSPAVEKAAPDRTEPQGEDRRIQRKPLSESPGDERFGTPDNYDNAGRDPQQIMDDNLSQYVTGRPN